MKRLLLLILFTALTYPAFAQSGPNAGRPELKPRFNLTGRVLTNDNDPVPYASVAIYDTAEANIITGNATADDGTFGIRVRPGKYLLKITYLSFKPYRKAIEIVQGERLELGDIRLEPSMESLGEVVVEGEKSQLQMQFDKRVFQVGTDLTSAGGSALTVLDNVPSVTTDIDGNVSLRGSENVRILINGKPSTMYSNGSTALQSLSANMIEKIEVITNPSARYDAEGEAGIINIILKKNRDRGVNGSVVASTGYPANHGLSANLNYRTNNINWFLNTGVDYRNRPGSGSIYQRYASPDTAYVYRQTRDMTRSQVSGNLRFGADITLPSSQTLTAYTSLGMDRGDNNTDLNYIDYAGDGSIFQEIARKDRENETEHDIEAGLSYEKKYSDFKDHKLTADLKYDFNRDGEKSNLDQFAQTGISDPLYQRTDNVESVGDLLFKVDYIHPFDKDTRFETGVKSTVRKVNNDYLVEELNSGAWQALPNYNENFTYDENINAAYAIFSNQAGRFGYQLGLRAEQANVKTKLKKSGESGSQSYLDLFPSAFLTYKFSEKHSLQASYSRRLWRPWFRMLLPFSNYTDSRNRYSGNPDLQPQYTDSYEFGYLWYWEGGSLLSSVFYRRSTGVIERITSLDGEGVTRIYPINLSTSDAWGLEFTASQEIGNGLRLNGNLNLFNSQRDGTYEGQRYRSSSEMLYGRFGMQWKFLNGWQYQANMRYRGPRTTTQGRSAAMSTVDSGLSREIFNGRGTLSMSVRDLLDTRKRNFTIDQPYFYSQNEFRWSSRSFTLNFTWRFNQNDRRSSRRGPGGGDNFGDDFEMD